MTNCSTLKTNQNGKTDTSIRIKCKVYLKFDEIALSDLWYDRIAVRRNFRTWTNIRCENKLSLRHVKYNYSTYIIMRAKLTVKYVLLCHNLHYIHMFVTWECTVILPVLAKKILHCHICSRRHWDRIRSGQVLSSDPVSKWPVPRIFLK